MTLAERLPSLDDLQLANLHANALRLQLEGGKRGDQAAELIPLIEQELAQRPPKRAAKAKPAPKRRVRAGAPEA
jgi:hypothetical protein